MYGAQRGRRTRWQSNYTLSVRHAPLCSEFSLGLAFELDALSIVHETIQDSICQGRVWDTQMPIRNGDLAGDEGGGVAEPMYPAPPVTKMFINLQNALTAVDTKQAIDQLSLAISR